MNRRVVVTGIGIVSPLGIGKNTFVERLFQGKSGIEDITAFDTSRFGSHLGAEVKEFRPKDFISTKNLRKMDRLSSFTTAAARLALTDAGITVDAGNRDRLGIILGTAYGPTDVTVQFARTLFTEGPAFVNPILVPNVVMNAPAGHASIEIGFRGVNTTVNHYATSAETAIAYGAAEIRRGAADVILAGGADILSEFFFESLVRFKSLSPAGGGDEGAKPFDRERNGSVAGEGCGILCLEAIDLALHRGASPYCEVAGWGMSAAPCPPTRWPEDPEGLALASVRAMKMAGVDAKDIDIIQAAANGDRGLDLFEAESYQRIFGTEGLKPLITSIKGAVGESFSSGGIRGAALAVSVKEDLVPPTVGLIHPLRRLPFVFGEKQAATMHYALLTGISYGGTFVSLVLSKLQATGADP